jgi:hypothetical protein
MHRVPGLLALSLLLYGCAVAPAHIVELTPQQAVFGAAEHPDEGIAGTFKFEVRGGGRQLAWLYINSETDYRDQRCLTVRFPPGLAQAFEEQLKADPVVALQGKTIRVTGVARRTTIWFFSHGRQTNKYYYQTHIPITNLDQIEILH